MGRNRKNKSNNKADETKKKQALVIIKNLFPKIKKELDKRNIKYKNSADAIFKFYKQVVRGKKNLETIEEAYFEHLNEEIPDEGLVPFLVPIIPLLPLIIPLLMEIVSFFKSQKDDKEAQDALNNANNEIPNADNVIPDEDVKSDEDKTIGYPNPHANKNTNEEPPTGSPFTSGLSIGMILAIGVGIFILLKMKK